MQSRRAPAFINTCHDARFAPHVGANVNRGNTPPTSRSPPHQSRPEGYPPNRQPVTVGEEERDGRGTTSRWTSTRATPERRPPPTARHARQPRTSSRHPREGGQRRRRTAAPRHAACGRPRPGQAPAAARPADATSHDTPRACQQQLDGGEADVPSSVTDPSTARCSKDVTTHHRSGARPRMPRPSLQRAATARQEKFQLPIAEQNFGLVCPSRTSEHGGEGDCV